MADKYHIDPDIAKAQTLPASFYRDSSVFERLKEKLFYKSWQWIGDDRLLGESGTAHPFILMDGFLTEPMVLTRNSEGKLHCLSNVCTHRGNIVVNQTGRYKKLSCAYHGRRFTIDGRFEFMPEFGEVEDFPRECDHLHSFPLEQWGNWLFAGLNPLFDIRDVIGQMNERIDFLPLNEFVYRPERSKDYIVKAHWALYCDNYLEGFHIPFVHEGLNEALDYGDYETVLFDHMNLQIGYAKDSGELFDFPEDHVDYGKNIAAYYFWVFPNMMFNFYPWGLSVNIVEPIDTDKTRVRFLSYVLDDTKLDKGAGGGLDKVELEDEEVVEGVQKGVRSAFYKAGRFSTTREKGVHHFHKLIASFLNKD